MASFSFSFLILLTAVMGICFVIAEEDNSLWPEFSCNPDYNSNTNYGLPKINKLCQEDHQVKKYKCHKLCVLRQSNIVVVDADKKAFTSFTLNAENLQAAINNHTGKLSSEERQQIGDKVMEECEGSVMRRLDHHDCNKWSDVFDCFDENLKC